MLYIIAPKISEGLVDMFAKKYVELYAEFGSDEVFVPFLHGDKKKVAKYLWLAEQWVLVELLPFED